MAKGAATTSTGSAIALSRGGSTPLGGKGVFVIGRGPEAGQIAPQQAAKFDTPRSANLRDFLRNSVKLERPDQIGFRSNPNPGEESVKTEVPLTLFSFKPKAKITELIPVVEQGPFRISRTLDTREEDARVDKQILEPKLDRLSPRAHEKVNKSEIHPYQIVMHFREVLARARGERVQAAPLTVSPAIEQVQTKALSAESVVATTSMLNPSARNGEVISRGQRKVVIAPRLVIDEETNKARIEAIKAEANRLRTLTPGKIVSLGISVIGAGVTYLNQFEAGLKRQLNLKKDGSQSWMHKDASVDNTGATDENIERFVGLHTAVVEGRGRVARTEEVYRVVRPPEELGPVINPEQALTKILVQELPEQKQITQNVSREPESAGLNESKAETVSVAEVSAAEDVLSINPNFVQSALDWGYIIDRAKSIFQRRQQVLAE